MQTEPLVFTSWKEIASYLGKGVRTVQRWEAEFGLPVKRPDARRRGIVLAMKNDLDRWLSARWSLRKPENLTVRDELSVLRKTIAELISENAALRRELEERGKGNNSRANPRFAGRDLNHSKSAYS